MPERDVHIQIDGLRLEAQGCVATLWITRSERRNALAKRHWDALPDLVRSAATRSNIRVLVLRGAGNTFCAGADIAEFKTARAPGGPAAAYERSNEAAFRAVRTCPLPTVAALEGVVFGGGFGLAAACDLRIAARDARFAVPPGKLGLAYPTEALSDIVAAVGTSGAKQLILTGRTFDAAEMERLGLLVEVAEVAEFEERLQRLVADVATLAPLSLRAAKTALAGDASIATELGERTFSSDDYREGLDAFLEKRPPRFTGR